MASSELTPDFVFETSWEVCNKVGGIHTVVSTKAQTMKSKFGDKLIMIGPDIWQNSEENPEFVEDKTLYSDWREMINRTDSRVRIGRWKIVGEPIVILVDFSQNISKKDKIFAEFWETYKLDSISGDWGYIEPVIFGYTAGKVIESFCTYNLKPENRVIAHFHEWMTGAGILYIEKYAPEIATVFTTHATAIGRSIAGNGQPLYGPIKSYDGDTKAREFNMVAKQSCEKLSALTADAYTTVSEITAIECKQFTYRAVDYVTPNGFEDDFVPKGSVFNTRRAAARAKMLEVASKLFDEKFDDKSTVILGTSGRYEYRNKGIDVFLESLKKIKDFGTLDKKKTLLAIITVPANHYGARPDLKAALNGGKEPVKNDQYSRYLTHGLHYVEYDAVCNRAIQLGIDNSKDSKIKLIFVPSYLKGDDGIFNMSYYDLLIGMDVTAYPSYYEPWGYTPMESIAFSVPTITTDLAGFGKYSQGLLPADAKPVVVLHRTDDNYNEVSENLAKAVIEYANLDAKKMEVNRKAAYALSQQFLWKNLAKYYIKAYSTALERTKTRYDAADFTRYSHESFNIKEIKVNNPIWRNIQVQPNLSGKFKGLEEMSYNLWWCWNYEAEEMWQTIGEDGLWDKSGQNPVQLMRMVDLNRLSELENDSEFIAKYEKVYSDFKAYMDEKKNAKGPSVAYFCMEYGIHDSLKIFSGGLGILAGDYLKEASDSNVDMVAVGLLYRYGYFRQKISVWGDQIAEDVPQDFKSLPITEVKDEKGNQLQIQVAFPGRKLTANVWKAQVGRIELYLLDTDFDANWQEDRGVTYHLYGGNQENRLKQEMLLGVGGIRALRKMGITKQIYHMNEGHAALMGIERLNNLITERNFTLNEALEIVRASTLYTTHTPVPAGHDAFPEDMIMTYMGHYPQRLGISWKEFLALGKKNVDDRGDKFNFSYLACQLSQEVNGVSMLHGEVTKNMFNYMWDGYYPEELNIGYVTNGVHYPTWAAKEWQQFYKKHFDPKFIKDQSNESLWNVIQNVDDAEIWKMRQQKRKDLIDYIKVKMAADYQARGEAPSSMVRIKNTLNPNTLTIGFARRFATYKRGNLLLTDLEMLKKIVDDPERPVQFIFAGKAHPADGGGQGIIKQIVEISKRPEFAGKILFLENYDIALAKKLVSGVDIWMNTPTRPLEASGTSGMKAVMNGAIHYSVLDGWWVEGYRPDGGWCLPQERAYQNQDYQNLLDAATIYRTIIEDICPKFYTRNAQGVPEQWVSVIKNSIGHIAPNFTMKRQLDDYYDRYYNKLAVSGADVNANDYQTARELAAWKHKVVQNWENIKVVKINFHEIVKDALYMGEEYFGEVVLDLGGLNPNDIGIEMVITELSNGGSKLLSTAPLTLQKSEGRFAHYSVELRPVKPGNFNYGFRLFPKNENLIHRTDFALVKWL